ncbi:hypothetical protein F4805DRAFT_388003 [Annulohypoxylon moriforme]|nr:hypothetical protein F4805DRAFT_388003 [Annulohypoxylon moriforme]
MAEVLGVAASGIAIIQISVQVGSAILKFKKLWDEVRDVPDDIANLLEQIDCLSPVISEVESNLSQGDLPSTIWDGLASKHTVRYCRNALQSLTDMTDQLNMQITTARKGRRKAAAFKVLLKKDSLRKFEKRLEHAIRMLALAQQSYHVALTRVQPNIIVEKFTALTLTGNLKQIQSNSEPEPKPETEERTIQSRSQKQPRGIRTTTNFCWGPRKSTRPGIFGRISTASSTLGHAILVQSPTWLSWRSWELHSIKATGSWQYNLRSYSVVPDDSEIMELAKRGHSNDMRKLFEAGLASPYDRDKYGCTLLHVASFYQNPSVLEYLIMDVGLDCSEPDDRRQYPAQMLLPWDFKLPNEEFFGLLLSDKTLAEVFFTFSSQIYSDEGDEEMPGSCAECNCISGINNLGIYQALLPYQCPSHKKTSLESRIRAAIGTLLEERRSLEVVKLILEPEWSNNPEAIRSSTPNALIKVIASGLCVMPRNKDEDLFAFAVDVIRLTPDLHIRHRQYLSPAKTPFMSVVGGICRIFDTSFSNVQSGLPSIRCLYPWLKALKIAGVDLNTYGHREHEIFIDDDHYFRAPYMGRYRDPIMLHLVGFKFGSEPEDWEFYWAEPTDEFAGDFWNLIENPPPSIPGSWVD